MSEPVKMSKERRSLLNNKINREITRRERLKSKEEATGVSSAAFGLPIPTGKLTTLSFYASANPIYYYWTVDKDKGQWLPEKFNKNIGLPEFIRDVYTNNVVMNPSFVNINTFSTEFIDAMDTLHSKMQQAQCITEREYEETFKRVFSASYNIARYYFEWEKTHFGVTKVCQKWHNTVWNE
jgi:hypothetical protein